MELKGTFFEKIIKRQILPGGKADITDNQYLPGKSTNPIRQSEPESGVQTFLPAVHLLLRLNTTH